MQLSTRVAESTVTIQDGMGRKIGDGINYASMAVLAIILALVKGWELALILLAFMPFIAFMGFLSTKALSTATQDGIDSYSKAGAIAQESLGNIRTVHMFNAIQYFADKYEAPLAASTKAGIRKGFAVGWGLGALFFTIFCTYAGGLFYGALKIANDRRDGCSHDCYDGGRVVTVFFATVMGAMAVGQAGPSIEAFFAARAAAFDVFEVIQRRSQIDPESDDGLKLPSVEGKIELESVSFAYPSRPDVLVCSDYSLTIHPGETVALVGPSGSGKSTIVALLERFYDPQAGSIRLDGVDVRELNVKWLRSQVGLVGQEPALFATSILENIRYGCPDASDDQVMDAARMANAYSFIAEFPLCFATEVGERGTQLSGGQKQRIAIARAIIKNPSILLLDEATSALDAESERAVQESLDVSKKEDARVGVVGGASFGLSQGVMFFNVAFLFYMGGKWVVDGRTTFQDMFMVIMVIMLSTSAVGIAAQTMTDQSQVRKAVARVFAVIDRVPEINAAAARGETLERVAGRLQFDNVAFAYPSRPDAKIYQRYNLTVESGQTVALVGASGSGKSTAIALLERFYDPSAGSVSLDGVGLRDLRLPWLRDHISLVSQEPVLFAGTIAENIAMGKPGATRDDVIDAAKKANAFDFISQFPDGFATEVGDRGAQVSGGQKQRIAIARAILRDPEVLLLDEATSALDNESERVVQESLDRLLAQKKRTTIIVAHRLSTIRQADVIAVVKDGAIVEQGTHDQLMAIQNGVYRSLVARQVAD